jgi:hypothetical protein
VGLGPHDRVFQTDRLPVISARVEARAGPCIAQKASLYGHKDAPPGANVYYVPGVTRKPTFPFRPAADVAVAPIGGAF